MKSKRGFEFGFAWIFAVMIGAVVIFLAIYTAVNIIELKKFESDTKSGKKIGIILDPISTNLEQAKFASIILPTETILHNNCTAPSQSQEFGSQTIATSSQIFTNSESTGATSSFHDRYLFSTPSLVGEEFYVLSKPLFLPFKVADILVLWSDKESYCFISPPTEIEQEINRLEPINIFLSNCPPHSKNVCFSSVINDCDIEVDRTEKKVTHKNKRPLFYVESADSTDKYPLLYAAIFSPEPENYECQIERILSRTAKLSLVYKEKANYLYSNYALCGGPLIQSFLDSYASYITRPDNLPSINALYSGLKKDNEQLTPCRLF